jgi:hypothetical protein
LPSSTSASSASADDSAFGSQRTSGCSRRTGRERALESRRLDVRDARAGEVLESARLDAVARIHQHGLGAFVTVGPHERRVRAIAVAARGAHLLRAEQAADADVRLAGDHAVDQRGRVGDGDDR